MGQFMLCGIGVMYNATGESKWSEFCQNFVWLFYAIHSRKVRQLAFGWQIKWHSTYRADDISTFLLYNTQFSTADNHFD